MTSQFVTVHFGVCGRTPPTDALPIRAKYVLMREHALNQIFRTPTCNTKYGVPLSSQVTNLPGFRRVVAKPGTGPCREPGRVCVPHMKDVRRLWFK